ncbi:MAG TPA: PPC domain-containing protein, partial [Aggregatilineales bacterium]|nr:PPC domain-containing protein [Aggregatilineales bacterium]
LKLEADGLYYITVSRATGITGATGDFTLALTSTTAAPGAAASATTVTLTQGITVDLNWSTGDDMNLEVRDPVGGAVNYHTPRVPSGGNLATGNVNADCTKAKTGANKETVSWPKGSVPVGSYEVISYFNQACTKPAANQTPAPIQFTATVTVDGKSLDPVRGTLGLGEEYVTSFVLTGAGTVTLGPGGVVTTSAIDTQPFASKLSAPSLLPAGLTATGTISSDNAGDAYGFDATNGQLVTINLDATSGSLDPFLVLLDPGGNIIASNDDASPQTRNSAIVNQPINTDGRYTILTTRFALAIGGTEGNYTLRVKLSTASASVRTATPAPTIPAGGATLGATVGAGALPPSNILTISLTWDSTADLRLLVRDPAGVSIFADAPQPSATSGAMPVISNLGCKNTTTSPVTYVYWPEGTQLVAGLYEIGVWQQSSCDVPISKVTTYTLSVTVGGRQVINEKGRPDLKGGHFLTTLVVDDQGNATQGKFKGIVTKDITTDKQFAADLPALNQTAPTLDYNTTVTGTIDRNTPYQIYILKVVAGDKLKITLNARSGNLDPTLFLIQINGSSVSQVGFNDDVKPGSSINSEIDFTFRGDGTFIVVATHYGLELGGTEGQYELIAAKQNR